MWKYHIGGIIVAIHDQYIEELDDYHVWEPWTMYQVPAGLMDYHGYVLQNSQPFLSNLDFLLLGMKHNILVKIFIWTWMLATPSGH